MQQDAGDGFQAPQADAAKRRRPRLRTSQKACLLLGGIGLVAAALCLLALHRAWQGFLAHAHWFLIQGAFLMFLLMAAFGVFNAFAYRTRKGISIAIGMGGLALVVAYWYVLTRHGIYVLPWL